VKEKYSGENNHMFGKSLSEETKAKISLAKTGEIHPFYLDEWMDRRLYRWKGGWEGPPFHPSFHSKNEWPKGSPSAGLCFINKG